MPKNSQASSMVQQNDALEVAPKPYFARRLSALDEPNMDSIRDSDLLAIQRSIIILGEPGMGKSEMIRYLSGEASVASVSASRLMNSRNPAVFIDRGQPLLIDALDEAMASSNCDAVDRVLACLEAAGCPRFILSCRAREWQSRTERDLNEIYGASPLVLSIDELSRAEARAFWTTRGFTIDADPVLTRMDEQNLSDLYKNPLTLTLLGSVADSGRALPKTRAELFEHVCELSWREPDASRQDTPLARLTQQQALSAAGALMASLILAGAEAVNLTDAGVVLDGDLPIAEVEALPGGDGARAVISSKLFRSVGAGRAAPIHRVVAEFLGAKWLAAHAATSRTRRRLAAQFQGAGAVPSSLRGLHAWLAFHCPPLAASVISADPFGLLRYGESSVLDAGQALALFDSLEILSRNDPYFRSQDWDARTAFGLAQPALASRIDLVISDPARNVHLRSLLLESVKGSSIAGGLSQTLERVVLAIERGYSERYLAIEVLLPLRDRVFWRATIEKLLQECSDDSARLARHLAEELQYDVPDEQLARILLADLDLLGPPSSKERNRRPIRIHVFDRLVAVLDPARAKAVLRQLSLNTTNTYPDAVDEHRDFSKLVSLLLLRALRGGQISTRDVPALWRWLETASKADHYDKETGKILVLEMHAREDLRRVVQRYGIWKINRRKRLWHAEHYLRARSISIAADPRDVAYFLEEISAQPQMSRRKLNDWEDLVDLSVRAGADNSLVVGAAAKFPNLSSKQRAHLRAKQRPRKFQWQIQAGLNAIRRANELIVQRGEVIRWYEADIVAIRRGDLQGVFEPAEVYLGRRMWDSDHSKKSPEERLSAFFNEQLAKEFMDGFEAVLHRSDLPSLSDLARSYVEGTVFNYSYPLIVGLLERQRTGRGLDGVPHQVLGEGLLLCMSRRHSFGDDESLTTLRSSIEHLVASSIDEKRQLVRVWIEPFLAARREVEQDICFIAQLPGWLEAGRLLAKEWLSRFRDTPLATEMEIVALLANAGDVDQILEAARERDHEAFQNDEQALAWLAIDVAYRFDEVREHLANIGRRTPNSSGNSATGSSPTDAAQS